MQVSVVFNYYIRTAFFLHGARDIAVQAARDRLPHPLSNRQLIRHPTVAKILRNDGTAIDHRVLIMNYHALCYYVKPPSLKGETSETMPRLLTTMAVNSAHARKSMHLRMQSTQAFTRAHHVDVVHHSIRSPPRLGRDG